MASIKKRGKGYQVTVSNGYDVNGKKIIETDTFIPDPGMTQKQIEKALNEFAVDFERDVKGGKNTSGGKINFQALSKLYLKDMAPPELAETSYYDYKQRLEKRINLAIGHLKISEINQRVLNDYSFMVKNEVKRMDGKEGALSDSSIHKDCALISSIISYAVGEGYLPLNPIIYSGKHKGRRKPSKEYRVQYFTMEQLIRFIDALEATVPIPHKEHTNLDDTGKTYIVPTYYQDFKVKTKWKLFFYLLIFCGDRRGENIALTWNDINFDKCEVNIDKSTVYVDHRLIQKDTKTHSSRHNTIPPSVVELAKKLKIEQQETSLKLGDAWNGFRGKEFDKNFVFIQDNGKQMHPTSAYDMYKKIIARYNAYIVEKEEDRIPDSIPMHGLRHSAAAILISQNLDARTVAGILGHKDPTTTLNVYSYFFKTKGEEASGIMENLLLKNNSSQIVAKQ